MLDGAISPFALTRAILALGGAGTSNLQVRVSRDITIGDRTYRAGGLISTGFDVAPWTLAPLGTKVIWDRGRLRVGITCAARHAVANPQTVRIIEGPPNADFNVGLLLAMASNSAAYFVHTTMPSLEPFLDKSRRITDLQGREAFLPNPEKFEAAVSDMLAAWPSGSFDATVDAVNNPTSIPSSYTRDAHPFGWSGFAMIGPFRGLTTLNNSVHALNSDEVALAGSVPSLLGIDKEVYLATILQRAANPEFRYDPASGQAPSVFLKSVGPLEAHLGADTDAPWHAENSLLAMIDRDLRAKVIAANKASRRASRPCRGRGA